MVDHIESDRDFDIELEDGTEIVGQPGGADAEGKQPKAGTIVEIPGHRWLFREPWFFSAKPSFERDPIIELD